MKILLVDRFPLLTIAIKGLITDRFPKITPLETELSTEHKTTANADDIVILPISGDDSLKVLRGLIGSFMNPRMGVKLLIFENGTPDYEKIPFYLRLGAWGYISSASPIEDIVNSLNNLVNGRKYFDPESVMWMLQNADRMVSFSGSGRPRHRQRLFTKTELEIATKLVKGERITAIARHRGNKISTISTIKKRIFEKAEVSNLIDLKRVMDWENTGLFPERGV